MSRIDDNRKYVGLASDGTDAVPLKVDASTGRLLIEITPVEDTTSTLHNGTPSANHKYVGLASDGTDPKALLVDSRNDLLFCDVLDEG